MLIVIAGRSTAHNPEVVLLYHPSVQLGTGMRFEKLRPSPDTLKAEQIGHLSYHSSMACLMKQSGNQDV